jgi:hypothetical protein
MAETISFASSWLLLSAAAEIQPTLTFTRTGAESLPSCRVIRVFVADRLAAAITWVVCFGQRAMTCPRLAGTANPL